MRRAILPLFNTTWAIIHRCQLKPSTHARIQCNIGNIACWLVYPCGVPNAIATRKSILPEGGLIGSIQVWGLLVRLSAKVVDASRWSFRADRRPMQWQQNWTIENRTHFILLVELSYISFHFWKVLLDSSAKAVFWERESWKCPFKLEDERDDSLTQCN